jgi:CDP-glycerol glycerophosphotransferase
MLLQVRRRLRRLIRPLWVLWSAELRAVWRRLPVRRRTVLYESFAGNGALCNPEAIFRELLRSPDMDDLHHIWVLKAPRRHPGFLSEFAKHPHVRFVRYRSTRYFRALATSEYLINNATFPPEFSKRESQIYVNTWHGTPLKRMGYDMPNGATESANTLRNFVSADYLLSQNPFMTHQMYEISYKLRGVFQGVVVEEGYPRVDRQFMNQERRLAARAQLESAGIALGERDIVLYAPTWKGDSFSSPDDNARELLDTARELQRSLGDDKYVVLLKTHQVIHHFVAAEAEYRPVLVPNEIPTNTVLGLSSILITDYSSILFDFLASARPIVFYRPHPAEYNSLRGTYFETEELPGPVCDDIVRVADAVRSFAGGEGNAPPPGSRYANWQERFASRDDGNASRRVVDVIFRGQANAHRTVSLAEDPRATVLLHLGSMRSNGITSSALNLLSCLDHDRFDVSVVFNTPSGSGQRANQMRIDPRVRQFQRAGGLGGGILAHVRRRIAEVGRRRGVHTSSARQRQMWDDEWARCFGKARFERIVDFDGYGPFWATLLLHGPASSHSIWLHNDMVAETHRIIRGRQRIRRSLGAVFALYPEFDALVSVSPSLGEINRRELSAAYGIDPARFVSARNLIDTVHIFEAAEMPLEEIISLEDGPGAGRMTTPEAAREIFAHTDTVWFITLGRFSTEKNHSRLVRAFAIVHRLHPECRLLLVGYGPLHSELEQLIRRLGLTASAFLVGPYANPFPLLAAADCFVLSSDHEGQPMVILEAATFGLPIISVNFESIRDAIPDSTIRIVEQNDDALAEGMLTFLRGEVLPQHLDAERYNQATMGEFIAAITTTVSEPNVARR